VASELAPLAQAGGLGDAVGGVAAALQARGHDLCCAVPAYRDLLEHPECPALAPAGPVSLDDPDGTLRGRWLAGRLASGVALRLLDLPALYDRPGVYGIGGDEARRFIALGRAAAELAAARPPDALVAHDWPAALAICVLGSLPVRAAPRRVATLQVVHNGAFIGRFAAGEMARTGLPERLFGPEGLEFYGDLCLLKAGLLFADRILTVSPGYAAELQTPAFGGGLDGIYRARGERLLGIANGIDTGRFDPARDDALAARYSADRLEGRRRCREALLDELSLAAPPGGPGWLVASIGRLSEQKGWDVLVRAIDGLVEAGASLALLGDGDEGIAAALEAASFRHPGRVRVARGWNEPLARRIYAGADALLVPSRFEPCGLVQLLAQRYGCLPVAHGVGGLVDTIEDGKTGVLFAPLSEDALLDAVRRAAALLDGPGEARVRRRLLSLDVSWKEPARRWEVAIEDAMRDAGGTV